MTVETNSQQRLGGSPAGFNHPRFSTLTLAAILLTGGAVAGLGQVQPQPDAAKPAKPVVETTSAPVPAQRVLGGYQVHQSIEVGGRYTRVNGSQPMWDTLINQGSGGRVLGETLDLRSLNPAKTPVFDTLTSYSTGYGGDPLDVTRLKFSKGRWYDFDGSFRRDRNYFDYNLLAQSLLGSNSLVAEPDSLHLFNTVRRNTDTNLTILPLSIVSFRAAYNHGTHEGPSYTTLHNGGDVQLLQWFRNSADTFTGGVDVKLAKRTTLSYDQFYVLYKGDSPFSLTGANYAVKNGGGLMESLGVDTLATATCGSGANKALEVVNGVANPYCSGTTVETQSSPIRTTFPTEQLRFSSGYWDRVAMNGRVLYSGGVSDVNSFNETFTGLLTRTYTRQEIDSGGLANGAMAHNKRVNVNADYGIVAELSKMFSVSDTFDFWAFRVPGSNSVNSTIWAGTATTPNLNINTPLSALPQTVTNSANQFFLNQKIIANTAMATATITPQFKLSGGWRFKTRNITDDGGDDLTWHFNGAVLGAVIQPSSALRINVNYDSMSSSSANATTTPSNTYTREAPNKINHVRVRATFKPANWINLAVTGNDYIAKNDDPLVNHSEHNQDVSFAATIIASEQLSFDFNYAYDDVYSRTDLCYLFTPTATAPLPPGAANSGTCVLSDSNPQGAPNLYLGKGLYDSPSNFVSASFNYAPMRKLRINAGARLNDVNGSAEQLNPLMVPGALASKYFTPFADIVLNIAPEWSWHGNYAYDGYGEQGAMNATVNGINIADGLPSRNTHGSILTLGVKYAF
jgi:hypothetical protein